MSIYGSMNFTSITESTSVISCSKKNTDWVRVYSENGKYYISGKELVEYMEAAEIFDFEEAVRNVEEANNVYNCVLNLDGFDESIVNTIKEETNLICEASPEDDATNLRKTIKWYNKFVKASKGDAYSKQELEHRIRVLKKCVKDMKKALETGDGRVKYTLKALIPFNDIYRLIKRQDIYAGVGIVTGYFGPLIRALGWKEMI